MNDCYKLETTEVLQHLGTDATQGLAAPESAHRLIEYGPNEFVEQGKRSTWQILWEQLTATMVIILIVAAILSGALGAFKDTIAIATIVVLYALLGFIQEYRAEQAMAALKKLAVPAVKVYRGGQLREISARELVPGDILQLETGNLVPADCRLLESVNLDTRSSSHRRVRAGRKTHKGSSRSRPTAGRPSQRGLYGYSCYFWTRASHCYRNWNANRVGQDCGLDSESGAKADPPPTAA